MTYTGWRMQDAGPKLRKPKWCAVCRFLVTPENCARSCRRYLFREGGSGRVLILPTGTRPEGHEAAAVRYVVGVVDGELVSPTQEEPQCLQP